MTPRTAAGYPTSGGRRPHRPTGNPRGRPEDPPTPAEARIRELPCPRCESRPGRRCTKPNGRTLAVSHLDRRLAAVAAGRLPITPTGQPWGVP